MAVQDALRYRMTRLVRQRTAIMCCCCSSCSGAAVFSQMPSSWCRKSEKASQLPLEPAAAGDWRGVGRPPAAEAQDCEPDGKHAVLRCAALCCAVLCCADWVDACSHKPVAQSLQASLDGSRAAFGQGQ